MKCVCLILDSISVDSIHNVLLLAFQKTEDEKNNTIITSPITFAWILSLI